MKIKNTRKILKTFSQTTSSHGIPHIGESRHKCMLVFWIVMTMLGAGLMIWQVTQLIVKYLEYNVAVGLQLKFEQRAFPAVTFCNMNPYQYSLVKEHPEQLQPVLDMLTTYQYALQRTSCTLEGNSTASEYPECSINNTLEEYVRRFKFDVTKILALPTFILSNLTGIIDTVALQAKARDLLVLLMAGSNLPDKNHLSIKKRDFIKSCSFNMKDCSIEEDFNVFFDPKLGNCFIFNKKYNPNYTREGEKYISQFDSNRAGPLYGLRLILLTNTSEYLPLTEKAGIMVVIHNQTDQPFPDTFGYSVEVGTATSIGVSYKEMQRLGAPYGECTVSTSSTVYVYNGTYTSEGCQRSCLQVRLNAACQCNDPNFPNYNKDDGQNYPQCNGSKEADIQCWNKNIGSDKANLIDGCECPLACSEGVFDVTVSAAQWPHKKMVKIADCKEGYYENSCLQTYRDNGVMVNVFYEQLNFQLLEESPAYQFVNLASDFGGQIGLWLGLSFISVIEFIVLILSVLAGCFECNKVVPFFAETGEGNM